MFTLSKPLKLLKSLKLCFATWHASIRLLKYFLTALKRFRYIGQTWANFGMSVFITCSLEVVAGKQHLVALVGEYRQWTGQLPQIFHRDERYTQGSEVLESTFSIRMTQNECLGEQVYLRTDQEVYLHQRLHVTFGCWKRYQRACKSHPRFLWLQWNLSSVSKPSELKHNSALLICT